MIENLLMGFGNIAGPMVLLALVGGTIIGYVIGAIPGLGPSLGIALLIPFTYGVDPVVSIVGLVALYIASEYGAAITAIVINTPGTAAAIATTWDGYPMAQRGEAGQALTVSILSSGVGAVISAVLLIFTAVPLAEMALQFGPSEYFALALFGLSLVSALSSGSQLKGFLAMAFGLLLVTIGLDPSTGVPRYTVTTDLFDGLPLVPCLLGLYAISEVLMMAEAKVLRKTSSQKVRGLLDIPRGTMRRIRGTVLRSSLIGYFVGVIPGAGPSIASLLAYTETRRRSDEPETFGKGNVQGVAASESANNAAVPGSLAPLLALGIPGSATAAILIGALMIQGVEPGPLLFAKHPEIPYTLFASLLVGVPIMILVGLMGARIWAMVSLVPMPVLAGTVAAVSFVGAYASANSMFPVWVTLGMGVVGYSFRKLQIPVAPVVLALVLGTMMETNFRRALITSNGDLTIFATHPITVGLLLAAALTLIVPLWRAWRRRDTGLGGTPAEGTER